MARDLQIRVYRQRKLLQSLAVCPPLEIGRQRPGEPGPIHLDARGSRLIVAAIDEKLISRQHLRLSSLHGDGERTPSVEICNLSQKRSLKLEGRCKLEPLQCIQLEPPFLISMGELAIRVESPTEAPEGEGEIYSLAQPVMIPGSPLTDDMSLASRECLLSSGQSFEPGQLTRWLSEMLSVLQSAAGASDFMRQAVDAADRIVGLDTVAALRLHQGVWTVEASKHSTSSCPELRSPSRRILDKLVQERSTVYHVPLQSAPAASLQDVRALVASPILDAQGNVIGALYGVRYRSGAMQIPQISELEATMVEVIAGSAAAGIAREKQQEKAIQARVQFEQFFTSELARELEQDPEMLEGREAEISVLFCDIASFSLVSQQLGPRTTMKWIRHVMDVLSESVLAFDGVVVDYIGDELMAMWGAPKPQPDHAYQACLAANAMLQCKVKIDAAWLERIGQPIQLRIGISSGLASVGNTGSQRRLKYGPLGNTVNLASRLQSAAKQLGVSQLISHNSASQLPRPGRLALRPLGTASFVNMDQPLPVYEPGPAEDKGFVSLAKDWEQLVRLLRTDQFSAAEIWLQQMLHSFPDDRPTRILTQRLRHGDIRPDCLWPLAIK